MLMLLSLCVSCGAQTVAKMTQGEVVTFAAGAADQMRADGMNVLMEGRAQVCHLPRSHPSMTFFR